MLTLFISSAATILVNHWYPCRRIPAFPSRWQLGFCGSLALLSISAAIVPSPSEMACQATPVVLVESGSAIVLQGFACVLFFCAGKILSGVSSHLLCKAGSPCLFIRGPPLGIAAHAGLPVLLGAGLAPRLAGNRRLAAVPALAEFPGSMQALLGIEPLVLHALRGLVSLPVVLDLILPLGFCLDRVRCGPLFRFCGPGGCFLEGFPCPSWVLPRGRASALVGRLRQGESELESMAYCPPVRGNLLGRYGDPAPQRSARPTDWPRRAPATTATPAPGAITRCWPSPPAPVPRRCVGSPGFVVERGDTAGTGQPHQPGEAVPGK